MVTALLSGEAKTQKDVLICRPKPFLLITLPLARTYMRDLASLPAFG